MTNAAKFDATGERLTRSTGPSPNSAYTVAFWVRIDTNRSADYQTLFTFLMGSNEWEQLMLDGSNRLAVEVGVSSSGTRSTAGSAFGTGTWRYVALVRSSTTSLKVYVNSTETLSLTTNVSSRSAAVSEFAFGSDTYNEDLRGSVAYARAWTAALNTTELSAESASASAVRTTDLWGDWPMQSDGEDATANNRDLTANGTVSYVTDGPTWTSTVTPAAISSAASVHSPTVSGAGATVTPDAIGSAAAVHAPTVSVGNAQNVAPDAISSAAALHAPSAAPGSVTVAPAAIASAVAVRVPDVLAGVCIGGTIQVSSSNARYFSQSGSIVVLSGFHTWETLVDHGDSDPPDVFDYDAFLDALVAKNNNFIKLWTCESLRDWCDAVKYFDPPVYQRNGPGNAADGKLKVDLTAFNPDYFERLRERAIEAGNRGLYVCVQLFQGWQVTQKGYSAGSPGTYHPFNAANNINSIDGDIDNDGQVGETRDVTWTAVYDLQKAYVRAVVDAVNDLDHIIYEISNEEDEEDNASGQTKVAWQHALIDYIHTYEAGKAKQHPVGMTVQYPSGSDSDLFSSNAEWISPKDASSVTSVTASNGDKVILWDTDHVVGLTDEHEWVWLAFCRGCSPLYMDEWDGDFYGTDKRSAAANVKIRDNLGYVLDYAARLDLANAVPNASIASTGYALAKTSGVAQILAYQNASGAFTVDLASISGTFSLEWLRTSTGATQAGSDVSGGAVRTLTPPWAGEDVVAFLELTALTIEPNAISSGATVQAPTITVGAVTVVPDAVASAAQVHAPVVSSGGFVVQPDAVAPGSAVYAPTLSVGAVTVVPATIDSAATLPAPVVSAGAVTVAPDGVASAAQVHAPVVSSGGFVVQPDAVAPGSAVYAPTLSVGAVTVVPATIDSAAVVYSPFAGNGAAQAVAPDVIASGAQVFVMAITAIVAGRIYRIGTDARAYTVPSETRTYTVTGD